MVEAARGVRRARWSVAAVFCVHGMVGGSLAARMPWVQDHAGASAGQLGLALAFPAIGAALAMPLAGRISHRLGSRRAMRVLLLVWTLALVLPAFAVNAWTLCGAMFLYGASSGTADVAMNTLGVEVERRMGRSVLSGLHGMWSLGAMAGAAGGALAARLDAGAQEHFLVAAAVMVVMGGAAGRGVPDPRPVDEEPPPRFALPPRSALLIGTVGFCSVFAEGASLNWSALYLHDALHSSAAVAAASTTCFTLTEAGTRLVGDAIVDRFGAVRVVRAGGVVAAAGGVLVMAAPGAAVAIAGFALLGLGVAVVVPLAFAAAGHAGPNSSQAIAGVATVTYASDLVAPSVIGVIAQVGSLVMSFGAVTLLAGGMCAFAGVLRPASRGAVPVARPDATGSEACAGPPVSR